MNKRRLPLHQVSGLFVFALLGVFALLSTLIVLFGVKAYRGAADRSGVHNAGRITSAYLRSMLRSEDETGVFSLENLNGIQTIRLTHDYDGEVYETRLYAYDGALREWFFDAEMEFLPEDGEEVCPADEMTAEMQGNLLTVRVRQGDEWSEVYQVLRTAGT